MLGLAACAWFHAQLLVALLFLWPQLGPLCDVPDVAELAGSLSGAGLVLILSLCADALAHLQDRMDSGAGGNMTDPFSI